MIQLKMKDFWQLLNTTFKEWYRKDPFRQSAVIAYYAIFSMPGLLLLIVTIAGYFFGRDIVNESLLTQISSTMGADIGIQIKEMLVNASASKPTIVGSIISVIILLVGATGVFVELQKSLNIIWQVKSVPQSGILTILKTRLFSFGLILAIAFLLLISLAISSMLAAMGSWLMSNSFGFWLVSINVINFIFSLIIISILFALIFKILPDAQIKWKHVWLGAVLTGLLFEIGKTALAFYFGEAHPASVYGAAGSVILILLWVSYSSMILFFGAEFTASYSKKYEKKILPTKIAKATI